MSHANFSLTQPHEICAKIKTYYLIFLTRIWSLVLYFPSAKMFSIITNLYLYIGYDHLLLFKFQIEIKADGTLKNLHRSNSLTEKNNNCLAEIKKKKKIK